MTLTLTFERAPGYAVGTLTGPARADDLHEAIAALADYTREHGDTRALANLLAVEGQLPFTEQFQLGHEVARRLSHLRKLASVVPADRLTRTSEKVALSLGMELRVFDNTEEAVAWLLA